MVNYIDGIDVDTANLEYEEFKDRRMRDLQHEQRFQQELASQGMNIKMRQVIERKAQQKGLKPEELMQVIDKAGPQVLDQLIDKHLDSFYEESFERSPAKPKRPRDKYGRFISSAQAPTQPQRQTEQPQRPGGSDSDLADAMKRLLPDDDPMLKYGS